MNHNNNYNWESGRKTEWRCPVSVLLILLVVTVIGTMLFTFNFTSNWVRQQDLIVIQQQQLTIDNLDSAIEEQEELIDSLQEALGAGEFNKLDFLATLLDHFSYYTNEFNKEQMLDEALRAYIQATGDNYADYYTEEEYLEINNDNVGSGFGIGVSIVKETLTVSGQEYLTFHVTTIFKGAPAEGSGLLVGDRIYAIETDGEYKTVEQLGGYTSVLKIIRNGEAGSAVNLRAFRADGNGGYNTIDVPVVRNNYVQQSVISRVSETDPSIGIVQITEFDLLTPIQFKQAVKALQEQGIQKFIFDVRNNPGGDLQSIRAVLSYILNDGDLILSAINSAGEVDYSVYAGQITYIGEYVSCNVAQEEVGMFADLDMVVLCNGNTASAAEVFVAGLRDHKNVTVVGQTTFGKGIMQRYISLSSLTGGVYDGWIKMTTHAYLTECGVTYHGIGIAPTQGYEVALTEEAAGYNFYLLPENLDNQLQKAIEAVNK